jgi:hypothetical protein
VAGANAGGPIAGLSRVLFACAAVASVVLALNQLLNLQLFIGVVLI